MTERLKDLGLMKGNVDDAVGAGAHALFFPHGLGHMMGLDVHDMEALGQRYVGYDEETRPNLEQFGTKFLRMGRRLQEGFVVTDEPGIYFIPALIDDWRKRGLHKDFINYDKVEEYKDFGGVRIEDDILITKDGCRIVGKDVIPYHPKDIEEFMSKKLIKINIRKNEKINDNGNHDDIHHGRQCRGEERLCQKPEQASVHNDQIGAYNKRKGSEQVGYLLGFLYAVFF